MAVKIYTKTGDDGTSCLIGGTRIRKSDLRLETYGTVDELNSWIGLIRSLVSDTALSEMLLQIQNDLFVAGSKLASDEKGLQFTEGLKVGVRETRNLEQAIDEYDDDLKPLSNFILPGGSQLVCFCHIARTVCRRAERRIVQLAGITHIDEDILRYFNRLSDYLFILARKIAGDNGIEEIPWIIKK